MKLTFKIKTVFHSLIFAYIYLMIALLIPTNFSVTAPNQSRSANTMVVIEGKEQTTNLKTMSVLNMTRISGFARLLYELNPQFDVNPLSIVESSLTGFEMRLRGSIQKNASFEQSLITAYTLASAIKPEVEINYELIGMIIDFRSLDYNVLNIGDIIVDIDDMGFTDYETMGLYFINNNKLLKLDVLRQGNIIEIIIDKTSNAVFRFYPKYNIISASPNYSLPGLSSGITGPSAGMMYTLSIYFALIDFNQIDEPIAGTGTIRYNNEVGAIGGLVQKIYGAHREGIKYFLVPQIHYDDVKHLDHLVTLYPVSTIESAIEVITNEIFD